MPGLDEPREYEVVRFSKDNRRRPKVVKRDLTMAEAMAWCNNPATQCPEWFDGFRKMT